MLNEEQVKKIKEQIIKQIDTWHATEEQKKEAKKQIQDMPLKQLEDFLIKNKLIKTQEAEKQPAQTQQERLSRKIQEQKAQQCPFCLISQGKLPAYKIEENKKSIAVLEINPLSKGHALVISRQHKKIEKLPSQAFTLAKKIASRIKRKFKAQSISIQTAEIFEHAAINIIPVYEDEKLEKKQASQEELKKLQEELIIKKKPEIETEKIKERKSKQLEKAPRRIP